MKLQGSFRNQIISMPGVLFILAIFLSRLTLYFLIFMKLSFIKHSGSSSAAALINCQIASTTDVTSGFQIKTSFLYKCITVVRKKDKSGFIFAQGY